MVIIPPLDYYVRESSTDIVLHIKMHTPVLKYRCCFWDALYGYTSSIITCGAFVCVDCQYGRGRTHLYSLHILCCQSYEGGSHFWLQILHCNYMQATKYAATERRFFSHSRSLNTQNIVDSAVVCCVERTVLKLSKMPPFVTKRLSPMAFLTLAAPLADAKKGTFGNSS